MRFASRCLLTGMDTASIEKKGHDKIIANFCSCFGSDVAKVVQTCETNFLTMNQKTPKVSMLEYCKLVLVKISFSRRLFRREYRKTFRYLGPKEHFELKNWLRNRLKKNPKAEYEPEVNTIAEISRAS